MKYAFVFSTLGATCFFYALNVQNVGAKIVLLSCALCWNGVGAAYAFNQPRVFGKRDDGQLAVWSWFVFWPCHFLNAMTMRFFRMTNREPWTKIDDAVFLGCRLRNRDELRSDNNLQIDSVLDLTSEFGEIAALRRLPYCCIPLLDTNAPSPAQLKCGVGWIIDNAQRGNVYVHCALGHGRSATFVVAYLMTTQHQTFDEALQIVQRLRRGIQLSKAQHRVLEVWNRSL